MNAIKVHRFGNWLYRHHFRRSAMLVQRLLFLIYNSAVPCQVEIGEGTEFAYAGIGVVLHADTLIGRDVLIGQHVTVGGRAPLRGVPVIEDGCFLGPGAVLLGPIRIGAGSIIGANAVVLSDVPARSVAAGVPAEIIRTDICTSDYYASHAAAGGEAVRLAAVGGKRG